jgi:hypothetical protein
MPCVQPLQAYQVYEPHKTIRDKKEKILFNQAAAQKFAAYRKIEIKCGQCIQCRLDHSMEWAFRIIAESKLYERNCFITLTYADEHLPENGQLIKRDLQLFKKRLRAKYSGNQEVYGVTTPTNKKHPIRTFDSGEYGDQFGRCHFHMATLNFKPYDLLPYKKTTRGDQLYTSKSMTKLWGMGHVTIGDLTPESASYVSRYVTKKYKGKEPEQHYSACDPSTGELFIRNPEFATMSRRPGIGLPFFNKYPQDCASGMLVMRKSTGEMIKRATPKYFEEKLKAIDPDAVQKLKDAREKALKEHRAAYPQEYTPERRKVVEEVFIKTKLQRLRKK